MNSSGATSQESNSQSSQCSQSLKRRGASIEELAGVLNTQLKQEVVDMQAERQALEEKRKELESLEGRVLGVVANMEDPIELNVGGQHVCTTRAVLCSVEGSMLAGMFSGRFDGGIPKDKDGRFLLDVDPVIFAMILSRLRLRRIAKPERLPRFRPVPNDMYEEYDQWMHYFGLDSLVESNIFESLAKMANVSQSSLMSSGIVRLSLSSSGGVGEPEHEKVLGSAGIVTGALENSYGKKPSTLKVSFLSHRVQVRTMELRARGAGLSEHMSNTWKFQHGDLVVDMAHPFTSSRPSTGRLATGVSNGFVDEIVWVFDGDFCLKQIVLYGSVMPAK